MEITQQINQMTLGQRMKYYESQYNHKIDKKGYLVIRLDGKAFHTYTKGFAKPFDVRLVDAMMETTKYLCENIQGAKFGYTQSDEITIIITDFDRPDTQSFYDGKIQKICSVTASMATAKFNEYMKSLVNSPNQLAMFDSRVFTFNQDQPEEAINAVIWRQQDAIKNSVSMVAQSQFSHKELHKKHQGDMKEMLRQVGHAWEDSPIHLQRGVAIKRYATEFKVPAGPFKGDTVVRNKFDFDLEMPVITEDRDYLRSILIVNNF